MRMADVVVQTPTNGESPSLYSKLQQYQIAIPPELPSILKRYAKAAIRTQPPDLLVWSAAYFKALSSGIPPPVKERIEYHSSVTSSGLTPGLLKVLINQVGQDEGKVVPKSTIVERWTDVCLSKEALDEIFNVGAFQKDTITWLKFVAICAGYLESRLSRTMVLIIELLGTETEEKLAAIPVKKFLMIYRYLAVMDCGPVDQRRSTTGDVSSLATEVSPFTDPGRIRTPEEGTVQTEVTEELVIKEIKDDNESQIVNDEETEENPKQELPEEQIENNEINPDEAEVLEDEKIADAVTTEENEAEENDVSGTDLQHEQSDTDSTEDETDEEQKEIEGQKLEQETESDKGSNNETNLENEEAESGKEEIEPAFEENVGDASEDRNVQSRDELNLEEIENVAEREAIVEGTGSPDVTTLSGGEGNGVDEKLEDVESKSMGDEPNEISTTLKGNQDDGSMPASPVESDKKDTNEEGEGEDKKEDALEATPEVAETSEAVDCEDQQVNIETDGPMVESEVEPSEEDEQKIESVAESNQEDEQKNESAEETNEEDEQKIESVAESNQEDEQKNESAEEPNEEDEQKIESVVQPSEEDEPKIESVEEPNEEDEQKIESVEEPNKEDVQNIESVGESNPEDEPKIESVEEPNQEQEPTVEPTEKDPEKDAEEMEVDAEKNVEETSEINKQNESMEIQENVEEDNENQKGDSASPIVEESSVDNKSDQAPLTPEQDNGGEEKGGTENVDVNVNEMNENEVKESAQNGDEKDDNLEEGDESRNSSAGKIESIQNKSDVDKTGGEDEMKTDTDGMNDANLEIEETGSEKDYNDNNLNEAGEEEPGQEPEVKQTTPTAEEVDDNVGVQSEECDSEQNQSNITTEANKTEEVGVEEEDVIESGNKNNENTGNEETIQETSDGNDASLANAEESLDNLDENGGNEDTAIGDELELQSPIERIPSGSNDVADSQSDLQAEAVTADDKEEEVEPSPTNADVMNLEGTNRGTPENENEQDVETVEESVVQTTNEEEVDEPSESQKQSESPSENETEKLSIDDDNNEKKDETEDSSVGVNKEWDEEESSNREEEIRQEEVISRQESALKSKPQLDLLANLRDIEDNEVNSDESKLSEDIEPHARDNLNELLQMVDEYKEDQSSENLNNDKEEVEEEPLESDMNQEEDGDGDVGQSQLRSGSSARSGRSRFAGVVRSGAEWSVLPPYYAYIPGIGPPVPEERIARVEKYLTEVSARQAGYVMASNIRHYLCPPLDP